MEPQPKTALPETEAAQSARSKLDRSYLQTLFVSFQDFPDPLLITDRDLRTVYFNNATERLLGYAQGQTCASVIAQPMATDGVGDSWSFVSACLEGRPVRRVPLRLRNSAGREVVLSVTANAIRNQHGEAIGCFATLSEIDPFGCDHLQAQATSNLIRYVLDSFYHPFFIVDSNLLVTYMNRRMEELTGYSSEQVVHRMKCSEVLSTSHCHTAQCLLRQVMATGRPVLGYESSILGPQGKSIPVAIDASAITDGSGRLLGGFETLRDLTPIRKATRKTELLAEMTQEGILIVDEKHHIAFANTRAAQFLGTSRQKLMGSEVSQVLPKQHQQVIAELMEKGGGDGSERISFCSMIPTMTTCGHDSRVLETSVTATHIGEATVACLFFTDLTERIEMERQILYANSFLHNIIRSSVDGIVVLDTKGNVLIFNEGAERITGYQADEIMGHPETLQRLYDPKVAKRNMQRMRSSQYGPPGKLNTTRIVLLNKEGHKIPVNFSAAIIKEGDKELGSVGIFSDLREHVKMRRELEAAKLQLLQAEKIASLGRLAAGVAHEINNPLAGILIYTDLLMRELEAHPQWKADLEEIVHQTLRCKDIVTRLLEFSRQPLGERILFNINELVGRCMGLLGHQSLFHDIALVHDKQDDIPQILGDPGQIQQVIVNLIVNAADAMNGQGRIALSTAFAPSAGEVMLSVLDTGPGIPEEIIDKIFDPFFTTKQPGKGTGLGLSIVYGIVQQHGGRIQVESPADGGARFTVWLPLEAPEIQSEILDLT